MADKGTLVSRRSGDIPSALQPKLLRVLQEREFERLGSGSHAQVDVRLVAASNRSLVKMVARGQFRSDLYYRSECLPNLAAGAARAPGRHSCSCYAFREAV